MPAQKPGRSRQDYGTPMAFIRAIEARYGPIVCDLAASKENAKAPAFYSRERNTLICSWATDYPTGNLFLNSEYSDIDPYAEKCWLESQNRQGLILSLWPASIGAGWFARHVNRKAMVLGLSPRLTFEGESTPYPKDLMLAVFGMGFVGFDTWRWCQ